ncbi:MAG: hypothetical protein IPI61_12510 [Syntrophaceae bacterium]|nr:hypothetical protein [Syntrophaceae bacterium]
MVNEFFGSKPGLPVHGPDQPRSPRSRTSAGSRPWAPAALTRERAGFEVRDVHGSHYGRICPVETPEGRNIGLIVSLSTHARVNEFGFIETPYRLVENGRVLNDIRCSPPSRRRSSSSPSRRRPGCQGPLHGAPDLRRRGGRVRHRRARGGGSHGRLPETSLSPWPRRSSLPGARRRQPRAHAPTWRQAIRFSSPRCRSSAREWSRSCQDSGAVVTARRAGVVEGVDAARIVIKCDEPSGAGFDTGVDIYNLTKYQRTNQDTCFNQRPVVVTGDQVEAGDIIADGPATQDGELALGRNVLVAFMSWGGYNYEDSILVSERIVKEDVCTPRCISRSSRRWPATAKLGKEGSPATSPTSARGPAQSRRQRHRPDGRLRRPATSSSARSRLRGDAPFPRGEAPAGHLRRKAGDVRDTSLRVPPGVRASSSTRRSPPAGAEGPPVGPDRGGRDQPDLPDRDDEIRIISGR